MRFKRLYLRRAKGEFFFAILFWVLISRTQSEAVFLGEHNPLYPSALSQNNLSLVSTPVSLPNPAFYLASAQPVSAIKPLVLDYLFPGKSEAELNITEQKILQWELEKWAGLLSQPEKFNLEKISQMLQLRKELRPEVEKLLYPVPLQTFNLPEWQRFSREIEKWVSWIKGEYAFVKEGAGIDEVTSRIFQGMDYARQGEIWKLSYGEGKKIGFVLNAEGRNLTQFDRIGFYIKGGISEGKLTGTTYFRIGFTDEQGMLMYDELVRDVLVEGIELSSEMGDWQLVEIDLKKIRDNNPGIAWNNIPGITIIFDKNELDLEDLPAEETNKGIMYFKDIQLVSGEAGKYGLSQVKDLLTQYISRKASLERALGRPLIPTIAEDRAMLKSGRRQSLTERESILPFLSEYYGRKFDLNLAADRGVYSYYDGKSVEEIKKLLSRAITYRPYVETLVGTRQPSEFLDVPMTAEGFTEKILRAVCEFFKATYDERTGLFVDSGDARNTSIDLSIAATGFGLTAVTMAAAWGWIDKNTARGWVEKALNTLLEIQNKQKRYEADLIRYLEGKFEAELSGLSGSDRFQKLEELRDEYEVEFLKSGKGLGNAYRLGRAEFLRARNVTPNRDGSAPTKGLEQEYNREFLCKYSDIYKYGRWGFYYRYLTRDTAERVVMDKRGAAVFNDLSTVDTAIAVEGVLVAGKYFGGEAERKSRQIYENIDWNIMLNPTQDDAFEGIFTMGWLPEAVGGYPKGFLRDEGQYWRIYTDEVILINLLAMGSPTFTPPIDKEGQPINIFVKFKRLGDDFIESPTGSLFTYHMNIWWDLRGLRDTEDIDWFGNSIKATLFNRNFVKDLAETGAYKTFNAHSWPVTTMLTPDGYIMHVGVLPGRAGFSEDAIVGVNGYGGASVHTLHAILDLWHLLGTKPELWTKEGTLDSFSDDVAYNRDGKWRAPTKVGFSQGMFLQLFNLLGEIPGAKGPSIWSIRNGIDYTQTARRNAGLESSAATGSPVETWEDGYSGFGRIAEQNLRSAIEAGKSEGEILALFDRIVQSPDDLTADGDFNAIVKMLEQKLSAQPQNHLLRYLIAETRIAQVRNIALAATGEKYPDSRTFEALKYYFQKSDRYYSEARRYLEQIPVGLYDFSVSDRLEVRVEALKFVVYKNTFQYTAQKESFARLASLIAVQPEAASLVQNIASLIYRYDYEGELGKAISEDRIIQDLNSWSLFGTVDRLDRRTAVYPDLEEARRKGIVLDPVLPSDGGVIQGVANPERKSDEVSPWELRAAARLMDLVERGLLGRPLDIYEPTGKETGLLFGLVREKGGFNDYMSQYIKQGLPPEEAFERAITKAEEKIKLGARLMSLLEHWAGHKYDIVYNQKERDFFFQEWNFVWQGVLEGDDIKGRGNKPSPRIYIEDMVVSPYSLAFIGGDHIISYLVVDKILGGAPLKINEAVILPVRFGDWSHISMFKILAKTDSAGGAFDLVIHTSDGKKAIFPVRNLGANWREITIPIWGPYRVDWLSDSDNPADWQPGNPNNWMYNQAWESWLTSDVVFRQITKACYGIASPSAVDIKKIRQESLDGISKYGDWSNIAAIEIRPISGSIYLSGLYSLGAASFDTTIDLRTDAGRAEFEALTKGKTVLIKTERAQELLVKEVSRGRITYINPAYGPNPFTETFADFMTKWGDRVKVLPILSH